MNARKEQNQKQRIANCNTKNLYFEKELIEGSISLSLDNSDPVCYHIYSKIKVQISLNFIHPLNKDTHDTNSSDISWTEWTKSKHTKDASTSTDDFTTTEEEPVSEPCCVDEMKIECSFVESKKVERTNDSPVVSKKPERRKRGRPRKIVNEMSSASVKEAVEHGKDNISNIHLRSAKEMCEDNEVKKKAKNRSITVGRGKIRNALKTQLKVKYKKRRLEETFEVKILKKRGRKPKKKLKEEEPKLLMMCEMTCEFCQVTFHTRQSFYDHKKLEITSSYNCSDCDKVFPFKAFMQIHKKFECCKSKSEVPGSKVPNPKGYPCDVCGVKLRNLYGLKKHNMYHTDEYLYKCCVCDKPYVEPGTMSNHMNSHISGGMIRCKCCDKLFVSRSALSKHQLATMEIKCHLCEQTFPNRTSRTQHYKLNHPYDILKCVKCSNLFSSQEELSLHLKKHKMYKKKQCPTCGKFFSRLEKHLLVHKVVADMDDSELYHCDKCPQKFSHRSSFQRHMTIHSTEKPYQCPHCPQMFADCGCLRKHLRKHSSLMPYQCDVCGKKCKESGNLKAHMRIHSEMRPFPCPICPHAFNYKSSLEGHMRSRHSTQEESRTSTLVSSASVDNTTSVSVSVQSVHPESTELTDLNVRDSSKPDLIQQELLQRTHPQMQRFIPAENKILYSNLNMNADNFNTLSMASRYVNTEGEEQNMAINLTSPYLHRTHHLPGLESGLHGAVEEKWIHHL